MSERPPALDPEKVEAFVAKAHGDVDYVRSTLATEPGLLNAAWDWGGGDWETALGDVATVQAILDAHPEARDAPGPHGIPLRAHAEAGGEQARAVLELL